METETRGGGGQYGEDHQLRVVSLAQDDPFNMNRKFDVLGVAVDTGDITTMLERVEAAVQATQKLIMVFCTVSTILLARRDQQLQEAIKHSTLVVPDGMPLVWLGKCAGNREISRVYGPDFMVAMFQRDDLEFRHFFYGGAPGVADELAHQLIARFPRLVVAGAWSPPLGISPLDVPEEEIRRINNARPDIVWVGLGHPKQEVWMHANKERIDAPVLAGVGAAFDFLSGRKKEAPEWMKKSGLQWLHRLVSEPRRLWRRYLIGNTVFIVLLLRERLLRRWRLPRN